MPMLRRLNDMRSLSRTRMTIPSPWIMGMIETRMSTSRPETLSLMRPSCGKRFSAMFSRAMIFKRLTIAALKVIDFRRRRLRLQHAVDAVANLHARRLATSM